MKALRNVLIHGYADVDLDTVWDIIYHDLPRSVSNSSSVLNIITPTTLLLTAQH